MKKEIILNLLTGLLNISIEELKNLKDTDDLCTFGLTSIKALEFLVLLEEEMQVKLNEEDIYISKVLTLNSISKLIDKYTE
ncbi:phosphopantetheine-binding protein [Clostridium sp. E02]|uniref:phosphopantetheine-binding protein n=1 Tax=Clostridium sp. E02 TaxID=2487134 RepID=UPI000F51E931|nr:phosphopantetheine-binding protein [Clostridium sp. E02]